MSENQPQATRILPVETLTQKIGTLIIQNDFLSDEVNRVSRLYLGLKGKLAAEIERVEADIEKGILIGGTGFADVKAVVERIKAKL